MENIESKYYTPDIEEFRVGFEYEKKHDDVERYLSKGVVWSIQKYGYDSTRLYKLVCQIQNKDIRVKYLDRADIEELGYKLIKERANPDEKIYPNYIGVFHFSNEDQEKLFTQISMYLYTDGTSDLKVAQYERTSNTTKQRSGPIFEGIVKNKSELKVLLKQLGL